MAIPPAKVEGFIAAEKHTIMRGFTLNPSSWLRRETLLQTLGADSAGNGAQVSAAAGNCTTMPVFCVFSGEVKALLGKGPTVVDNGLKRTVVLPHNKGNGARNRKSRKIDINIPA
jgi:hypothetical protein